LAAFGGAGRAAPSVADATHDLYRQYGKQIYAYCLHQLRSREEAEDAVQTTFLNAFRSLERGTTTRFEQAWLYKIAQNVCIARRSSSGRRLRLEAPDDFETLQEVVPSETSAGDGDTLELMGLDTALDQMPANQRRAILMREWQGLSYREIATALGLSQGAVEMLIFRARRTLARALEQPDAVQKRRVGRTRTGFSLGSLIAALKGLASTGAVVKMAAVAAGAAVVGTNTVHSVVRDVTHPTQAKPVASAAPTPAPRPATPIASHTAVQFVVSKHSVVARSHHGVVGSPPTGGGASFSATPVVADDASVAPQETTSSNPPVAAATADAANAPSSDPVEAVRVTASALSPPASASGSPGSSGGGPGGGSDSGSGGGSGGSRDGGPSGGNGDDGGAHHHGDHGHGDGGNGDGAGAGGGKHHSGGDGSGAITSTTTDTTTTDPTASTATTDTTTTTATPPTTTTTTNGSPTTTTDTTTTTTTTTTTDTTTASGTGGDGGSSGDGGGDGHRHGGGGDGGGNGHHNGH